MGRAGETHSATDGVFPGLPARRRRLGATAPLLLTPVLSASVLKEKLKSNQRQFAVSKYERPCLLRRRNNWIFNPF